MAIKTSTFSGWRLSGEDAEALLNQLDAPPNPLAQAAIKAGRHLVEEYNNKGYVSIQPDRNQMNSNSKGAC